MAVSVGCQFVMNLAVEIGRPGLGCAGIDFSPFQILNQPWVAGFLLIEFTGSLCSVKEL
jgi:hypothetical protein